MTIEQHKREPDASAHQREPAASAQQPGMLGQGAGPAVAPVDSGVAETDASAAAQSLLALADHLPDVVGRVDRRRRYVFINRVVTDITGRSREDYLGRTDEELGHPAALCRLWRRQYEEVFATGQPNELEFVYQAPDGPMHFHKRVVPEPAPDGSVATVVFIARDVTSVKQADRQDLIQGHALAELNRIYATPTASEERLRVLTETATQAVWETDAAGRVVTDSPSWRAYTGQSLDAWLANRWAEAVHPDDRACAQRCWRDAVASGQPLDAEVRLRTAAGAWRWSNVRAAPLRAPDGRIRKWVGMHLDIAARKEAQAALEATRQQAELERKRLEAVLEATPLAVVLIDAATRRCTYQNRRAVELAGTSFGGRDLAAHAHQLQVMHPDGSPCPIEEWPVEQSFASGEVVHQREMILKRPDGVALPVLVSTAPVLDCRGEIGAAVVVFDDITQRKAGEAALVELNRALEARVAEVSRQAGQLRGLASQLSRVEQHERQRLAKILHDHIQQLIVAAQMRSATLLRDAATERQRDAARAVQDVLAEALEVSRSLTVELSPPVLRETGLIGALDWLAGRMQEQHDFTVRLHAETGTEPQSEEMRFLLFECARELLLNVVKHAGVNAADLMLLRPRPGELSLTVSDEGRGFEQEVVSRRGDDETHFGLFSIKERLAHLGGRLGILSEPGRGTQVTLNVPLTQTPAVAGLAEAVRQSTAAAPDPADRRRVLVVDDHQIMRQGLAGLFQSEDDIDVVGEAADGEQAVAMAAALHPDVVIMDVNLGDGMDGVEATRRVLAAEPGVRVIGLSMHVDSAVADAMRAAGAAAYLTKGGPCEELLAAIRAATPA